MTIIRTTIVDVPKNTVRWFIKKNLEVNNALHKTSVDILKQRNGQFELTTTELPNGKTRFTSVHRWNTQADLDAWLAFLAPYVAERTAYNTANNIDYTETTTEE